MAGERGVSDSSRFGRFLSPWLTLRQAREALRAGLPDDARRLLAPLIADGYRKAIRLMREVARSYALRGERALRADNPGAAWKELLAAEALNTGDETAIRLRQTLVRLGLAECRAALEAGNPLHVVDTAARLVDRNAGGAELDVLLSASQDWLLAADQADRGEFLLAADTLGRAKKSLDGPVVAGIEKFADQLCARHERFRDALGRVDDAVEANRWADAVSAADVALAAAPNHREARSLRAKAWAAVNPNSDSEVVPLVALASVARAARRTLLEVERPPAATTLTYAGAATPQPDSVTESPPPTGPLPKRFLLWVDGVGGYLVCLGSRITLGQATADGPVDLPLFAELSRLHAELTRDDEGYVLESAREIQVNGTPTKRAVLRQGDRLTFGATCQMVFHQPVPVSPSAKLELASGHRLPVAVDGVLLMAESLVFGPGQRVHVRLPSVPNHPGNVVIYRSKDGLGVRFDGAYTVDGRPCRGASPLPLPAVVASDLFTFAVEPVGPRL